jgi:hypothetical protein
MCTFWLEDIGPEGPDAAAAGPELNVPPARTSSAEVGPPGLGGRADWSRRGSGSFRGWLSGRNVFGV